MWAELPHKWGKLNSELVRSSGIPGRDINGEAIQEYKDVKVHFVGAWYMILSLLVRISKLIPGSCQLHLCTIQHLLCGW